MSCLPNDRTLSAHATYNSLYTVILLFWAIKLHLRFASKDKAQTILFESWCFLEISIDQTYWLTVFTHSSSFLTVNRETTGILDAWPVAYVTLF